MEKNKLMMIIVIFVLLVLAGTIVGVSVYTLTVVNGAKGEGGESIATGAVKELSPDQITIYNIDTPFKTNLLTGADGNDHVISVSVSFAVSNVNKKENKKLTETLESSDELTKSKILRVIRSKTAEELTEDVSGQEVLEDDILKVLQEVYETNLIVEVFVSEMYVY